MTPKSDIIDVCGEGGEGSTRVLPFKEDIEAPMLRLARRVFMSDPEGLSGTPVEDCKVEVRLDILGILVGVSFVSTPAPPRDEDGRFDVDEAGPIDGEPAIGGRFCRVLRSDESDALFPGDAGVLDDAIDIRDRGGADGGGIDVEAEPPDFKFATR